ncbi:MAG: hypothetical protein QG567_37 [Campylobacterota bacterium]|nr:hypothetical protein [Campylobacterota bacterium]
MIDFLCIGAQKSGTTLLYEHLKEIEELFLPEQKELHFFDNDKNFIQGLDWYKKHFANAKKEQIKGEITPAYIFFEKVPQRIRKISDNHDGLKFIVLLRNPIDRAYSHYNMTNKRQRENLTFEEAIMYEMYRLEDYKEMIDYSYISRGFYSEQIMRYFKYFHKKQFKFILYEDFVLNQEKYINEITSFLGIDKKVDIKNKVVFQNEYEKMSINTKIMLAKIYEKEINCLENIIDLDLSIWK